jgi:hypothetical protein
MRSVRCGFLCRRQVSEEENREQEGKDAVHGWFLVKCRKGEGMGAGKKRTFYSRSVIRRPVNWRTAL